MPLRTEIHLKYNSRIWNIYSAGDNLLLLELRDDQTMSSEFDLYDIYNQQYVWKELSLDESWRSGVSFFNERKLIFHIYDMGTLPRVNELLVYDTLKGQLINKIKGLQPTNIRENLVEGINDKEELKRLDPVTGKEIEEADIFSEDNVMNSVVLPLTYKEDAEGFATVRSYIMNTFEEEAVGLAEYLEYKNYIFFSYHIKDQEQLCNFLVVLEQDGELLLKEQIASGDKYFSDTFFLFGDHLIYIIGQQELKAVKL